MAVRHGYGKVVTDGLVFAYDTGDTKNSYLGAPMFNASREVHNWPTKARATVTEYTVGDIEPPFPGAKISKAVCTSTSSGILLRDGGYYYGGGFAGTGNPQNTDLLSDRTNSYTPVGDNKFTFVVYAKSGPDTDDNTTVGIDIGDKNIVNVTNLENYDDWVRLETDDSGGINSQYPYDFFDISFSNTSVGNTIYLSAPMIIRTLGTDSGSLGTPPANIQYLPPKASRSYTGSLFDLTGTSEVDVTNVNFDSNAQFIFEGSERANIDYTDTDLDGNPEFTTEAVIKRTANLSSAGFWGIGGDVSLKGINGYTHPSHTNKIGIDLWGTATFHTGQDYPLNEYVHVVWVKEDGAFNTTNIKIYVNGVLYTGSDLTTVRGSSHTPNLNTSTSNKGLVIGRVGPQTNLYHANGEMPMFKVYTRALTPKEVAQNFAHYKNRFNI